MVRRKRIALLIESSRAYGRGLLRGISSYVRMHHNWSIDLQSRSPEDPPPPWLANWDGDGIIARVESREMERAISAVGVPAIDVRGAFDLGMPLVETDEHSTCRIAFEHLTRRGFRQLAFCGFEGANYSERRQRYFAQLAHSAGLTLHQFATPLPMRPSREELTLSIREQLAILFDDTMFDWLRALPRPVGLLACNDVRGQQVLNACRELDIAVPEEIAVLGVDNDSLHCELSDPPLSSVVLNSERIGRVAARLLDRIIDHCEQPPPKTFIDAVRVETRLSTDITAIADRAVAAAARFIRMHACRGITIDEVAAEAHLSRRQLERRFRDSYGRSLHDEITRVRLQRVKDLLRETDLPLKRIAELTGYDYPEYLGAVFRKCEHTTPSAYRRAQRA